MTLSLHSILALARYSVQSPRDAARTILGLGIPDSARWLLALFVAVTSALLTHVAFNMLPVQERVFLAGAMSSPLRTAGLQVLFLLITAAGVHRIGQWRGGTGSFADALLLVGWLHFLLVCLQAVQIATFFVLPVLAEILGVIGIGLSFWLLSQFVAELHGFRSALRVFAGILAVLFAVALGASMLIILMMGAGA